MTPALELVSVASVQVAPPQDLGEMPGGRRRIIPILGGRFEGPGLNATVLPGGADWQVIRPDGLTELEARYCLRTDDGALVAVVNFGLRHGPPAVMARMLAGEPVEPESYYFRTQPRLTTGDARYDWLNRTLFVGQGIREPDRVGLRVFAVR